MKFILSTYSIVDNLEDQENRKCRTGCDSCYVLDVIIYDDLDDCTLIMYDGGDDDCVILMILIFAVTMMLTLIIYDGRGVCVMVIILLVNKIEMIKNDLYVIGDYCRNCFSVLFSFLPFVLNC